MLATCYHHLGEIRILNGQIAAQSKSEFLGIDVVFNAPQGFQCVARLTTIGQVYFGLEWRMHGVTVN